MVTPSTRAAAMGRENTGGLSATVPDAPTSSFVGGTATPAASVVPARAPVRPRREQPAASVAPTAAAARATTAAVRADRERSRGGRPAPVGYDRRGIVRECTRGFIGARGRPRR